MAKKAVNVFGWNSQLPPSQDQIIWPNVIIIGLLGFFLGSAVGALIIWNLPLLPPLSIPPWQYAAGFFKMGFHRLMPFAFGDASAEMGRHLAMLSERHLLWLLTVRMGLAGSFGAAAGYFMGRDEARPSNGMIHMEGAQLREGKAAVLSLNRTFAPQIKKIGGDYHIHDEVQLTQEQWSKHGCYIGQPGSGKTTALLKVVRQIFEKDDKAIIHDVKGDFIAKYPKGTIIGAWDKRGLPWLLALDVQDEQAAEEFAVLIPVDEKQPMWGNAARSIFVGLIIDLQRRMGTSWGWQSLYNQLTISDEKTLVEIMERCNPLALDAVAGAEQTTAGILVNLKADLSWIKYLAVAWGDPDGKTQGFSLMDWLLNEKTKHRQLILANNIRYARMVKGYSTAMMSVLNSRMMSLEFGESRERIIWLIFDELPQLGRIPDVEKYIELGRSKGIRFWFGFQNISQMYEIYKKGTTDSLISMMGTLIVCQVGPGETAEAVHKLLGTRTIERRNISESGSGSGKSTSVTYNRDKVDIIHISELSKGVGNRPELEGVLAFYISSESEDIHKLFWKWDKTPKHRLAYVAAPWINGSHVPALSQEEAFANSLNAIEDGVTVHGESLTAPKPMTEEERLRQETRAEFKAAAARSAQRKFNERLGPEPEELVRKRSDSARKAAEEDAQLQGKHSQRVQESQDNLRALKAQELGNQSAFQKRMFMEEQDDGNLATEAASAQHDGEHLGHALGLGHDGGHAMGTMVMGATIAAELVKPGPTTDPIEIRKRQMAIERNRGRAPLMRPEYR